MFLPHTSPQLSLIDDSEELDSIALSAARSFNTLRPERGEEPLPWYQLVHPRVFAQRVQAGTGEEESGGYDALESPEEDEYDYSGEVIETDSEDDNRLRALRERVAGASAESSGMGSLKGLETRGNTPMAGTSAESSGMGSFESLESSGDSPGASEEPSLSSLIEGTEGSG